MFVRQETGENLDLVMACANFTLQNTRLETVGVPLLKAAGVDVVVSGSVLGTGLLRRKGIPEGVEGDMYPAPQGLKAMIRKANDLCEEKGEVMEKVAQHYPIENWLSAGVEVGTKGELEVEERGKQLLDELTELKLEKFGVSVMDVGTLEELEETMRVWKSILNTSERGRGFGPEEYAR